MSLPTNIIQQSDFVGYYGLYKGTDGKIEAYITQFVPSLIRYLFGYELGQLVITNRNIAETPANRYYGLINGIQTDDTDYKGLKSLLLGMVWFQYVVNDKYRQTAGGTKIQQAEVSTDASFDMDFVYQKYNESVKSWKELQKYLKCNKEEYPEFKGKDKKYTSWL
jgi:hypothetical protein